MLSELTRFRERLMKLEPVSFREFIRANKEAWDQLFWFVAFYSLTLAIFFVENSTALLVQSFLPFPVHYVPEWISLLQLGYVIAKLKKTWLSPRTLILCAYVVVTVWTLVLLTFTIGLILSFFFGSPLVLGYYLAKRHEQRKNKHVCPNCGQEFWT